MKNSSATLSARDVSSASYSPQENRTLGFDTVKATKLNAFGIVVSRYGLALIILIFGVFKFTNFEAEAIQPLVANSPLMSWLYQLTDLRGASALIGIAEIALAVMIALRAWFPTISALGSLGAILMFITSLSFLISTPGMWTIMEGLPVPTDGGFVMKDIVLLGVSIWTAGEALLIAQSKKTQLKHK
ncbi:YkgB family protein [Olivibacter sp. XZL3]|uniref:YkgB family protein n=1 Tax=Olivibacter sp. XZL3 TaxID=1735116 RepID=UPI0010659246|nr:DUF417 family protein [Olivibacter sp. XZL3]